MKKTLKVNIGDCFAYQIKDDSEFKGRYIILCARDLPFEQEAPYIYDFFLVKITKSNELPKTQQEINALENVTVNITFMEERFLPLDLFSPLEPQIEEKSKIKVYPDDMGILHTYTIKMRITRWAQMNELVYLGNFLIEMPKNEFMPSEDINIPLYVFEYLEEDILSVYKAHGLRRGELWHNTKEQMKEIGERKANFWYKISHELQEDKKRINLREKLFTQKGVD